MAAGWLLFSQTRRALSFSPLAASPWSSRLPTLPGLCTQAEQSGFEDAQQGDEKGGPQERREQLVVCMCVCTCVQPVCCRANSLEKALSFIRGWRDELGGGGEISKRLSWPSRSGMLGPLCRQWKGAAENLRLRGSSHMTLVLLVGSPLDSQLESRGMGFAVGVLRWASWNVNSAEGGGLPAPPSQINSCQWPPGWTLEGCTLAWRKC